MIDNRLISNINSSKLCQKSHTLILSKYNEASLNHICMSSYKLSEMLVAKSRTSSSFFYYFLGKYLSIGRQFSIFLKTDKFLNIFCKHKGICVMMSFTINSDLYDNFV